jgi:hypothetical protein
MATVIEGSHLQNAYRKYDWDSWLDGKQWMLEQGVDFMSPPESFRIYAYTAAKKRGIKLSTHSFDRDGKRFLSIQAHFVPAQVQHP